MRLLNLSINFYCELLSSSSWWFVFLFFFSHYISAKFQDSAFLSEVAVNHLKMARGEIWPKRSEKKKKKKLPRWGQKSTIKINTHIPSVNRIIDTTLVKKNSFGFEAKYGHLMFNFFSWCQHFVINFKFLWK